MFVLCIIEYIFLCKILFPYIYSLFLELNLDLFSLLFSTFNSFRRKCSVKQKKEFSLNEHTFASMTIVWLIYKGRMPNYCLISSICI